MGLHCTCFGSKKSQLLFLLFFHSFIHFRYLYSAPSRFLLRGAPDYSVDTESEFHAEAHEQLRVKDLPRVPTWRLEVDSNPQPSGCKALNIPLHHCIVLTSN